jgi:hypothetical protein
MGDGGDNERTISATMANVNSITSELRVYRHVHKITQMDHLLSEMGYSTFCGPVFICICVNSMISCMPRSVALNVRFS